ncbi:MAG: PD-(D/E)XK nuclease family protein, partial [Planctomycetota bacterium]
PLYSALDSVQKEIVHRTIDATGKVPEWLEGVGDIVGYIDPPHHSKFFYEDDATGLRVRGQADLILKRRDGRLAIVDLKTSRSCGKDMLRPTYLVQQNAYAQAAKAQGLGEVASLHLAYMALDSEQSIITTLIDSNACEVTAGFRPQLYPLDLDESILAPLCKQHLDLVNTEQMPEPLEGCKDCDLVLRMAAAMELNTVGYAGQAAASLPHAGYDVPSAHSQSAVQMKVLNATYFKMLHRSDAEARRFIKTWGRKIYGQLGHSE